MKFLKFMALSSALFYLSSAAAGDQSATSDWNIKGSTDFYYQYNFSSPSTVGVPNPGALPNSQNQYRAFDVSHDSLQLALARVSFQKQVGNLGFLLDLGFGPSMMLLSGTAVDSTQFGLKQAIVSYKTDSGVLLEAGRFATHVGLEYADSSDNWNYSRSLMYGYLQPYWHQGVRASYSVGQFSFLATVVDGWNSGYETNDDKGYGAQVAWNPNEKASLVFNILTGREPLAADPTQSSRKAIYDLLGSLKLSEKLSLAVNADFYSVKLSQTAPHSEAYAVAGYLKYAFNEKWSVAPRVEYFNDPDNAALAGSFADGQHLMAYTLTLEDKISEHLATRIEGRIDSSSQEAFVVDGVGHRTQSTLTFAVLAGF